MGTTFLMYDDGVDVNAEIYTKKRSDFWAPRISEIPKVLMKKVHMNLRDLVMWPLNLLFAAISWADR